MQQTNQKLIEYLREEDTFTQVPNTSINHNQNIYNTIKNNVSTKEHISPKYITIIGGHGRMGNFFTNQLLTAGHQVNKLGKDWENADILLGKADLVLVSVPIEATVEIIKRAAKYLNPDTALADITSLKAEPVKAMLQYHAGAVMGLHPMFGPNVESFAGQKIVVCSGRNDEPFQWLLDLMQTSGGELIFCTSEEHDRMMVMIQATRHFCRLTQGVFIAQEELNIDRSLSMSTPAYRDEIEIVKRLFKQSPELCVDIILATEERCQAISSLANTYQKLANLVANKDREALIKEFSTAQSFWRE
jgi:prephenate dehydrogenase